MPSSLRYGYFSSSCSPILSALYVMSTVHAFYPSANQPHWRTVAARLLLFADLILFILQHHFPRYFSCGFIFAPSTSCLIFVYSVPVSVAAVRETTDLIKVQCAICLIVSKSWPFRFVLLCAATQNRISCSWK